MYNDQLNFITYISYVRSVLEIFKIRQIIIFITNNTLIPIKGWKDKT